MPVLTSEKFRSEIRSGKIGSLYFLVGEEIYLRDMAFNTLLDAALDPGSRTFNLDVFTASQAVPGDIVDRILSFPMMAPRRVVVVNGCGELKEDASRLLIPVLESPPESTTLIFVGDRVDGRKKLFGLLRKKARVVEFSALREKDRISWIEGHIKTLGKGISKDGLHLFCERATKDLCVVAGEIEKLVLFIGDRPVIQRDDVAGATGLSGESSIFDFTDAVGAKNSGRALWILSKIREAGERAGGIVWRLTKHVQTLMKIRMLQESREKEKEFPNLLGLPPYVTSKLVRQSQKFSNSDFGKACEALVTAEDRLKSGYQTEEIVLQLLVVSLCR